MRVRKGKWELMRRILISESAMLDTSCLDLIIILYGFNNLVLLLDVVGIHFLILSIPCSVQYYTEWAFSWPFSSKASNSA